MIQATWATPADPRVQISWQQRIAAVSAALGEPLLPWQQQISRAIGAVHPDDPRRWRWPLVVITVPRQAGKTTALRAVHVDRLLRPNPDRRPPRRPQTIWTTAQTGKDARRRWADLANIIETNKTFSVAVKRRDSIGSEALKFGPMSLSPFAPTPKALHGETTPFVSIDEAWAFDEPASAALMAAVAPTMQNEPGKQLIVISTAGTRKSAWLWSLVKDGRASVENPDADMAYFEWSADPDADPFSPETITNFHPAVGHITTAQDILALRSSAGSVENWRRAFLNLWPDNMDAQKRDMGGFDSQVRDIPPPPDGTVIAFDVAADRSAATIFSAWPTPGGVHVALVRTAPGAVWVPSALAAMAPPGARIVADPVGYTGVAAELATRTHQLTITAVSPRDVAAATSGWLAGIADRTITHDGTPELRDALEIAPLTSLAGGLAFDARRAGGAIDALRAASLAAWAASHTTPPPAIFY